MKKWWIGCSGFHYSGWKGTFYPQGLPQRKWFEYYCQYFNTVELNVTFYRFPKVSDLKGWYDRSPEDFRFTCKAPRGITHYKKFVNAKDYADRFYEAVNQGLKAKLGTILFQLHPHMHYSEQNLERIIHTLDPSIKNVVEFRHESWWNDHVRKVLQENGITFCGISYPGLPDEVMKSSPVMYYRFHGVPQLYLSSYSETKLRLVAEKIKTSRKVDEVYCYFNNDIKVAAIRNAKALNTLVRNPKADFKLGADRKV